MSDLTYELATQLISADFDAGKLFWKPRAERMFISVKAAKAWNSRYAGKEAFNAVDSQGYFKGVVLNRKYMTHRVIWLLHAGEWPADQIDHINGDRRDNRIVNLRDVSCAENARNKRISPLNTSGVTGVRWHRHNQRWVSQIKIDTHFKHIGSFKRFEDAVAARRAAEIELGFHPNHGRAA